LLAAGMMGRKATYFFLKVLNPALLNLKDWSSLDKKKYQHFNATGRPII
jgi:hypothetical protein